MMTEEATKVEAFPEVSDRKVELPEGSTDLVSEQLILLNHNLSRILEFFPKEQHFAILHRLGQTLTFVLSQSLLPGFNGRVLVTEYLQNTSDTVAAGMRAYDGNATSLEDTLRYNGNRRWEESMLQLYRSEQISENIFKENLL